MAKSVREYNSEEMKLGRLTWRHLEQLIRYWQAQHGVRVDGKAGPITRSTLEPTQPSQLALAVVTRVLAEKGNGEGDGHNNSGPDVARYKRVKHVPGKRMSGSWCAWFASYILTEALREVHGSTVVWRVGGAKKLVRTLGESDVGEPVDWTQGVIPGDFVAWDRGAPGGWEGHVGIVVAASDESGRFAYVDGNVGRYPALVKERHGRLSDRRIELVARPV